MVQLESAPRRVSTSWLGRSPAPRPGGEEILYGDLRCRLHSPPLSSPRAPTDCVQYFTGAAGNVKNYNFGQLLLAQYYTNCIRTEKGRCGILWKTSSTTSPDPFLIAAPGTTAANAGTNPGNECPSGFVHIPGLSMDGINPIPVPLGLQAFQSFMCGTIWGVEGQTTAASLVCK